MRNRLIKRFLFGLSLAVTLGAAPGFGQSMTGERASKRVTLMEAEMLARAEQRADELRARLDDLYAREADLQDRLDDLDYRLKPENIQRALAFVGSVRPMDELRDALRVRLENEKARVNKQLELLESNRERLEAAIDQADAEVRRLRQRLGSS